MTSGLIAQPLLKEIYVSLPSQSFKLKDFTEAVIPIVGAFWIDSCRVNKV